MEIKISFKEAELASALETFADALAKALNKYNSNEAIKNTPENQKEPQEPEKKETKDDTTPPWEGETPKALQITLEQVRAKLAALTQAGKQAEVKKLLNSFGAKKLTEVPAEKYAELLKAAEEL